MMTIPTRNALTLTLLTCRPVFDGDAGDQTTVGKLRRWRYFRPVLNFSDGYTLIETLVAVMLLAISMVTIMQLFSGGLRTIRFSKDYERAVMYASEQMERIRLMPELTEATLGDDLDGGYRYEAQIRDVGGDGLGAQRGSGNLSQFSITVTIFWPSGSRQKSLSLYSLRTALALTTE